MATTKKSATKVASTTEVDTKKITGKKVAAKKASEQSKSSTKDTDTDATAKKGAVGKPMAEKGETAKSTKKTATSKAKVNGEATETAAKKTSKAKKEDNVKDTSSAAEVTGADQKASAKTSSGKAKATTAKKQDEVQEDEPEIAEHKAKLKKALKKSKEKTQKAKGASKAIVFPKTTTEKSRKYEPEFTKSVLDQAPEEYEGPSLRYNDNDLVEFRELITRKLESAKKELGYLQGLITRKDQMGGDESENRYMTMEDGSLSMEREQLGQMASRQITFIDHLEKALMRIENKTYGVCRVTGKLIDKARLRAVPHATLSIEAKMGINK